MNKQFREAQIEAYSLWTQRILYQAQISINDDTAKFAYRIIRIQKRKTRELSRPIKEGEG